MSLKEDLEKTIDKAEWAWLTPHLERDALLLVGTSLDLLQVAVEIAENQTPKIQVYLNEGLLSKPKAMQIEAWNQMPDKLFKIAIVQPFVLIQQVLADS